MSSMDKKPSLESLRDDLLLSCIARVSRLYYLTLSLVSKRFRSLLASPELSKVRSLLRNTDNCFYVCLGCHRESHYQWFTLRQRPDRSQTNGDTKSSGYVLATVTIPHSPHLPNTSLVAVGSDIYNIGGCKNKGVSSSRVSILDCQSHTWREGPSLPMELMTYSASVVDQKIYVAGRNKHGCYSFNVLDIKTQTWDSMPVPTSETYGHPCYFKSACIDGKFHVKAASEVVAYNSVEARWELAGQALCAYMITESYYSIDNVLYSGFNGVLRWYDSKVRMWKELKGLVGLPNSKLPRSASRVRLAAYGGKMVVMWIDLPRCGTYSKKNMIWCAEIALTRIKDCEEIWGKVEWVDCVLTIPMDYYIMKALATTI